MQGLNSPPKSCWTVLNVENDPGNVLLMEGMIGRRSDLRSLTAMTGNEGCEMACSLLPDTILLNIGSPAINGFEALKILLENPATAHIAVIVLSSDAYPHQIKNGLKAGFFRYMTKPYKLVVLIAAIDDALRHAAENRLLE